MKEHSIYQRSLKVVSTITDISKKNSTSDTEERFCKNMVAVFPERGTVSIMVYAIKIFKNLTTSNIRRRSLVDTIKQIRIRIHLQAFFLGYDK